MPARLFADVFARIGGAVAAPDGELALIVASKLVALVRFALGTGSAVGAAVVAVIRDILDAGRPGPPLTGVFRVLGRGFRHGTRDIVHRSHFALFERLLANREPGPADVVFHEFLVEFLAVPENADRFAALVPVDALLALALERPASDVSEPLADLLDRCFSELAKPPPPLPDELTFRLLRGRGAVQGSALVVESDVAEFIGDRFVGPSFYF
jgi:hypothetical protein